jgi:PBP1b-binding outer membrane lipoprotein LpoB
MKYILTIGLLMSLFTGCSSKEKPVAKKPEVKVDAQKRDTLFKEMDESLNK